MNLLATGELESLQERHDFMQRELDDVRKARRDLLEVIAQIDRADHRDVHHGVSATWRCSSSG